MAFYSTHDPMSHDSDMDTESSRRPMPGLGRPQEINRATAISASSSSTKPSDIDSKPTVDAAMTNETPAKILTIPQELRDMIYEYVYKSDNRLVFVTEKGVESAVTLRPFTPPLRLVCKQLSRESLEPFLKFSIFYDDEPDIHPSPMHRWLATIPFELRKKIKTIRVYRSTAETNEIKNDMLYMRRCRMAMAVDTGINPEAYQTTFTGPNKNRVWASKMPAYFKWHHRNGERRRRPRLIKAVTDP